jgi:hypothetical protein
VTERTDPSAVEPAPATPPAPVEPALDAIQPHPGRDVAWPPRPDQRGLAAPYPPGGTDPEPDRGLREERYYLRLLLAMVLVIVVGGFVIGIIGLLLGFTGSAG